MRATLIGLVALLGSGPALAQDTAGDPEAGYRVANQCQGCHGMDGFEGSESTPRLGGQPAAYLAAQLHAFHSGERESANRTMSLVAKILKDEQIADVAAWYASQTATPVLPDGFSIATAPEQCFGCHNVTRSMAAGAEGIAPRQAVPNLAGHPAPIWRLRWKPSAAARGKAR
jgi:cytochrome c553